MPAGARACSGAGSLLCIILPHPVAFPTSRTHCLSTTSNLLLPNVQATFGRTGEEGDELLAQLAELPAVRGRLAGTASGALAEGGEDGAGATDAGAMQQAAEEAVAESQEMLEAARAGGDAAELAEAQAQLQAAQEAAGVGSPEGKAGAMDGEEEGA